MMNPHYMIGALFHPKHLGGKTTNQISLAASKTQELHKAKGH